MKREIVGGVTYGSYIGWWPEVVVNFDFEQKLTELVDHLIASGLDHPKAVARAEEMMEHFLDGDGGVELYGAWKKDEQDKWVVDTDSDDDVAFIYNCDSGYVQVVWSRYVKLCRWCSPCFPRQGNLDTTNGNVLAYCIPPDMMGNYWMEEYGQNIFKLDEINDEWFEEMEQREQEEAQEAWEPEN